ncbi:BREX-1 system adenine-specific DNA-methyltransferase PglX [Anaerosolibacter sp.]|uniref:BREX-1 system adenine-specific DNA-methyltransferase PglX n=1 Tax=Anaerosolibacter sp. TaxID=1872527 RepID=UPI0039F0CB3C
MNKTAIKNFATWARRKLISEITYKAGLIGISEKGISQPLSISTDNIQFFDIGTGKPTEISDHEIKQRDALVSKIREKESMSDYKTAFQSVIEEVAYTWFNRLIAIRFMEVNDYLPSRIRVLSSEMPEKSEPDMVTTPFDTDMVFSAYETDRITQLKHENELDELFRMLFIKQCNKLNEVLPELFEKTADYSELLLTISFTDSDGIVIHLVNEIAEEDFTEAVEIIGWLYQYYNTEPKDEVFELLKKNVKITKERIPAATQLFTPDWIVRYMVENSLGRLWIEGHPNESLKSEWIYYLEEAEQEYSVKDQLDKIRFEYKKLSPADIKIIDPCMGSGHILVYAFDILMQIYESQGYTQRDAANTIIENNLYGLDIDDRAYQLAYFAVMMKARKYDRRFLTRGISPKIYSIKESNGTNKAHLKYFGNSLTLIERNNAIQQMEYLISIYHDAKEYGSILNIENLNWELLNIFVDDYDIEGQLTLDSVGAEQTQVKLRVLVMIGKAMAEKYDVVITNPPYMGLSGGNAKINDYVKKIYPDSKTDLFAVFIEKCNLMAHERSFIAMITQHSWMFLSSFEMLRSKVIMSDVINMAHLGARAFEEIGGEVVQTASWIQRKSNIKNYKATFSRLIDYNSQQAKEEAFLSHENNYLANKENFSKIPGSPIAYWVSENLLSVYLKSKVLGEIAAPRKGNSTSDNNRFLRLWFEVSNEKMNLHATEIIKEDSKKKRWYPYNKGGGYRKWYGFNEYLVDWYNDAEEIRNIKTAVIANYQYFMKPGLTWSTVSSSNFSIRWFDEGYIFDNGGCCIFELGNKREYLIALLNSSVFKYIFGQLNPTLNFQSGEVAKFPVILELNERIDNLAIKNVKIAKDDWDSFETSWDFKKHPLLNGSNMQIAFNHWQNECSERLNQLKCNEEEINRFFIKIYGLQDELVPDVDEKNVTVRMADLQGDVRGLISYAVGCLFGRYSLDEEGLAYAGGEWKASQYRNFIPDKDNCIPITDEEYFEDDIVGRFLEFIKFVYGANTFEENLDFIAKALQTKGNTSREIIRNYFVKEFYKDHLKTYQKRPIYWLYDSGKQDGFKALVYMHRYTADTTGIVRVDYLHKMQKIYMSEIDRMKDMVENSNNVREVAQAEKRKEKLIKQLKETKEYDEKIAHLALSRIAIDLDDGVKVNYEKVQTGQDGKKLDILGKI